MMFLWMSGGTNVVTGTSDAVESTPPRKTGAGSRYAIQCWGAMSADA